MNTSSELDLLDFVGFFEAEPEWTHADGWHLGARFRTQRGQDLVIATLAPFDTELSMQWWQGEVQRLNFRAVMASGWSLQCSPQQEVLRVTFQNERVKYCSIQLKPYVAVDWVMDW